MPEIVIKNLTVKFEVGRNHQIITALDKLSTTFHNGKINVIIGISGSGKTTLLRSLIGSVLINGSITFDGIDIEPVPTAHRNISYVSQEYTLLPNNTIFENIAFPLTLTNATNEEITERVYTIARKLGIEECLTRRPRHLSAGQRQRAALAKALIKHSDLYLFDEPFANLDEKIATELRRELRNLLISYNATTIFVTHKISEAMAIADYMYVIEDGKVIEEGLPKDVYNSKKKVVREYFAKHDDLSKLHHD